MAQTIQRAHSLLRFCERGEIDRLFPTQHKFGRLAFNYASDRRTLFHPQRRFPCFKIETMGHPEGQKPSGQRSRLPTACDVQQVGE